MRYAPSSFGSAVTPSLPAATPRPARGPEPVVSAAAGQVNAFLGFAGADRGRFHREGEAPAEPRLGRVSGRCNGSASRDRQGAVNPQFGEPRPPGGGWSRTAPWRSRPAPATRNARERPGRSLALPKSDTPELTSWRPVNRDRQGAGGDSLHPSRYHKRTCGMPNVRLFSLALTGGGAGKIVTRGSRGSGGEA